MSKNADSKNFGVIDRVHELDTPFSHNGDQFAHLLPHDDRKWFQRPNLLRLYICLAGFVFYASSIGYDSGITNSIQALPAWTLAMNDPTGTWLGFINASPFVGTVGTILVVPYFCDRFGRKPMVFACTFFIVLGTILGAAAQNPATYIAGRFMMGISFSCNYAVPVWINEMAYPTSRGKFSAAYHAVYYFGSVLCAWVVFGTRVYAGDTSWRIPLGLQPLIPVLLFPIVLYAPESPRWHASKGNYAKARDILMRYHANYEPEYEPLVDFEMKEIITSLEIQSANNFSSWKSMFATSGNRHRLFISGFLGLAFSWNGQGIVTWYLSSVLESINMNVLQRTLINGFLQTWNLGIAILGACLVDYVGRRKLLLLSVSGLFLTYVGLTTVTAAYQSLHKDVGPGIIAFVFLVLGCHSFAFSPLCTAYPAEIWPQQLRAKGIIFSMFFLNGATFFNIFVNSIALAKLKWKYYCVYLGIQVIIFNVIYFTFPETKGYSLEEISLIFDKDENTQGRLGHIVSATPDSAD